jgi:hypothetical protein
MSYASQEFEILEARTLLSAAKDVTVMSQNLYLGADLLPVIEALASGNGPAVVDAVSQTYAKVVATNFPERAKSIAKEITDAGADLVGMKEAAIWRTGPADSLTGGTAPATNVQYDFLQSLLDALAARGAHYKPVVITQTFDAEAPGVTAAGLQDVRFTDREVILARSDLKTSELKLSHPAEGFFQTNTIIPLPTGPVVYQRGYAEIDAKVRGKSFRFITTHLDNEFEPIRQAQAAELLAGPANTSLPVVLVGDFNAPADGTSPTYTGLVASGLTDAWSATHPGDPGFTWGQNELVNNPTSTLSQRIDFVFTHGGITPKSMDVVGDTPADKTPSCLWPSDHAGIVATLVLSNKPVNAPPFSTVPVAHHDDALEELFA